MVIAVRRDIAGKTTQDLLEDIVSHLDAWPGGAWSVDTSRTAGTRVTDLAYLACEGDSITVRRTFEASGTRLNFRLQLPPGAVRFRTAIGGWPHITVAADRAPEQIATEVKRRLYPSMMVVLEELGRLEEAETDRRRSVRKLVERIEVATGGCVKELRDRTTSAGAELYGSSAGMTVEVWHDGRGSVKTGTIDADLLVDIVGTVVYASQLHEQGKEVMDAAKAGRGSPVERVAMAALADARDAFHALNHVRLAKLIGRIDRAYAGMKEVYGDSETA